MTNDPDQTSPDSVSPTTTDALDAGTPAASDSRATDALDAGTYDRVLEPRSENRLPLGDGVWHQISRRYIAAQLISTGAFLALVVAAALVFWLVLGQVWILIPAAIVIVITLWTLAILPRQARAYGYQLRADDLVFRRGILWQRMVAVPYGRMQLVDITRGPIARAFGLAELKLVTAAAASGVTIPGLPEADAEQLRDRLVELAETRRAGL